MTNHSTKHSESAIELRIRGSNQLFESFDPSPFREKALDSAAYRYILSCARESAPAQFVIVQAAEQLTIAAVQCDHERWPN